MDVWEYLLNASVQTTEGCNGLNLIQKTFDSCGEPCATTGATTEELLYRLFELDSDGIGGIRVIIDTGTLTSTPCKPLFTGKDVIRNYIATATDGKPALIIRIEVPA